MREYEIVRTDAERLVWQSTRWRELIRQVPKARDGCITLDGRVYVIDPSRVQRRYDWRTFHLGKKEVLLYTWVENNPEQLPIPSKYVKSDDDFTGTVIATLGRSERLRRLVMPETNWLLILLAFSIIGNIALAVMVYQATKGVR